MNEQKTKEPVGEIKVVAYDSSLKQSTAAQITRTFETDPLMRAMYPESEYKWLEMGPPFFGRALDLFEQLEMTDCVQDSKGNVLASALWEPPAMTCGYICGLIGFFFWYLWEFGWSKFSQLGDMYMLLEGKREKHAPTAIHLQLLGTDPEVQSRGLGSRVIKLGLDRADALKVPCYLESSNPRNIPFYKRHGFQTIEEIYPLEKDQNVEGKGPLVTLMLRPSSSAAVEKSDEKRSVALTVGSVATTEDVAVIKTNDNEANETSQTPVEEGVQQEEESKV